MGIRAKFRSYPHYFIAALPLLADNAARGTSSTYNPELGEADVKVKFTPPEGQDITEITLKWESSDPLSTNSQSIGIGEISFNYL